MTPDKVEAALGVLGSLLRYAEAQICQHDETHRGGSIWEICDQCGVAWADDRGGKPAFEWPAEIVASHEAISVLTEALAERGWRPIAEAPEGFGIGLFLGYEPGDFGPVVYGMCRGPFGDWKLGADPEFEVSPTHFALMPSTRELPHDR